MSTIVGEHTVIDPRANIDEDVEIGPFCVVGPNVSVGRGTRLINSVTLTGHVTLGRYNQLHPGVVIGGDPQDLSYQGSPTEVVIGDHNIFRECVTVNRATEKEKHVTSIGDHCFLMACSHVAHDCCIGDRVVMANGVLLGGHVRVGHHATISGGSAVHHFASIGAYTFVTGMSRVIHDVPPYMLLDGQPARPRCINVVALKRNDFPPRDIEALTEAHRLIYRAKVGLDRAREMLRSNGHLVPCVNHLLGSLQAQAEGRHGRGRDKRKAA
ncbi:MAG: acyl-ACP--UDP-N-acetylglucosamine O-acyltransferase [Pirellulaceae bacterium]